MPRGSPSPRVGVAEAHRLAPGDRDRVEVPRPPELRAVDGPANDRHVFLHGDHSGPGHHLAENASFLPGAFDEQAKGVPLGDDLLHPAHCYAIGLTAADQEGPEALDQLAEPRHLVHLGLGHEVDDPRHRCSRTPGSIHEKWFIASTTPPVGGMRSAP